PARRTGCRLHQLTEPVARRATAGLAGTRPACPLRKAALDGSRRGAPGRPGDTSGGESRRHRLPVPLSPRLARAAPPVAVRQMGPCHVGQHLRLRGLGAPERRNLAARSGPLPRRLLRRRQRPPTRPPLLADRAGSRLGARHDRDAQHAGSHRHLGRGAAAGAGRTDPSPTLPFARGGSLKAFALPFARGGSLKAFALPFARGGSLKAFALPFARGGSAEQFSSLRRREPTTGSPSLRRREPTTGSPSLRRREPTTGSPSLRRRGQGGGSPSLRR